MRSGVRLISTGMLLWGALLATLGACTPRVEVAPSDKPITINLNVKIDHEIRLKVEKDLDEVISNDSGLF
ncbi:MAG: YnbE family lipoprotein [Nitrospira sp.]|nr:YnbE family lipoprotein [Nitrospira sp.]